MIVANKKGCNERATMQVAQTNTFFCKQHAEQMEDLMGWDMEPISQQFTPCSTNASHAQAEYYCKNCAQVYCGSCIVKTHASHAYFEITKSNEHWQKELEPQIQKAKQQLDELLILEKKTKEIKVEMQKVSIGELLPVPQHNAKTKNAGETFFDNYVQKVERLKAKWLAKLDELQQNQFAQFEKQFDSIAAQKSSMEMVSTGIACGLNKIPPAQQAIVAEKCKVCNTIVDIAGIGWWNKNC